jgi:ABC-type transport system substrate-binding protein
VPDLAAGPPQVSPDAMTITVKLRRGVRFSPPVNREVTSSRCSSRRSRAAIQASGGNNNLAELDDAKVDAAMTRAATLRGAARLSAWGQIDKMITADAPAVPLLWDKTTVLESKDVQGVGNVYDDTWDLAWTSVK